MKYHGSWGGANNNLNIVPTRLINTGTYIIRDTKGARVLEVKYMKKRMRIRRFWKNKGSTEQTKANKVGINYQYMHKSTRSRQIHCVYDEYYW